MSGSKVDAKVVLLGKEYGGKTSLVERYLHNRFSGDLPYQNTIGAAYGAKRTEAFGRTVVLGIWDTAGSERYQAMSRIYYRSTWAAILCYDLTERSSWEKAQFWSSELRQHEPNAHMYFVGTKKDLIESDPKLRQVDYYSVVEFAQGITHKLDEHFVKHEVSEFSMEWNPNVELSRACGCALSPQPHALDSSTFGFHSIENSDTSCFTNCSSNLCVISKSTTRLPSLRRAARAGRTSWKSSTASPRITSRK